MPVRISIPLTMTLREMVRAAQIGVDVRSTFYDLCYEGQLCYVENDRGGRIVYLFTGQVAGHLVKVFDEDWNEDMMRNCAHDVELMYPALDQKKL